MGKQKKKNRKLLLEIGLITALYSVIALIIVCALLYAVTIYIYIAAKEEQLEENLEHVVQKTFFDEYAPQLTDRLLDYLEEHPEVMIRSLEYDFNEQTDLLDEEYLDFLDQWEGDYGSQEFLEAIPEELMPVAIEELYWGIYYRLLSEQEEYRYEKMLLLKLPDTSYASDAMVLFAGDNSDDISVDYLFYDNYRIIEYAKKMGIGERIPYEINTKREFTDRIRTRNPEVRFDVNWKESANESITGYYPVYVDGEKRLILSITYSWADFQDQVKASTSGLMWIALGIILLSETLLLLFVYFVAVRPLRKVKKALSRYIETKDADDVVREMREVKLRNEFGLLADDISSMVQEIERYTAENIEIAGERERTATELMLAAKIQNGMLRIDFPNTPEVEIYAMMDPAKEVGGDFYDFFEIDATHMALVIADVAGKGVPGSLFMMSALTVIRDKTQAGVSPAQILAEVNQELVKGDFGDMFVTVWLGILDLESGILTAANAGHEYPVVKTGEQFEMLKDKHGFVVGGIEGVRYQDYEIDLGSGGTVFVYTDGVPEATAADEEQYGTGRLLDILNKNADASPEALAGAVKQDVDRFVGEAEQFDDLTILCVRYHKSALRKNG